MPTSHNQTVDRTRLLLIHTILTGYKINVGEILAKELAAACANDKGILAFPCLVSADMGQPMKWAIFDRSGSRIEVSIFPATN
ncbi:hypothetical protein V6N11_071446 [Hibiscus sabdariffa]|uniref:Uncharacterized protein n=1 Tax=Hibiscus sabdariffa TaxID=183260 RepID=A0ABR2U029_9ROSI